MSDAQRLNAPTFPRRRLAATAAAGLLPLLAGCAGGPGGVESVVVLLLVVVLFGIFALWVAYKVLMWLKSVVEHGVGMNEEEK